MASKDEKKVITQVKKKRRKNKKVSILLFAVFRILD